KEVVPQARAGLLPQLGAGGRIGDSRIALDEPAATVKRSSHVVQASLSQPLFRADRWFQWQAAKETSDQAKLEFSATQQDLILRSAETY
ncbi:TolC family protein, partial [Pseudomonas aeruginosa]